jgi:pimeloyl-ACP methyl ester carboxylesterase
MSTVETRLGPLEITIAGDGPPAVLWHSLFVDSTSWARVIPALATHRRLIAIDGPAHGRNPRVRTPFGLADCVGAAEDVLEHAGGAGAVDWVGNAWGGHVGILFAAAHPDRVRSLVAIGAPTHALTAAERRSVTLLRWLYGALGPAPVKRPLVAALIGPDAAPADAAVITEAFSRAGRRGMFDAISRLSLARPDLTPTLRGLTIPTLLITNADDPMWTLDAAAAAVADNQNVALALTPGRGHIGPLLQAPAAVADLVIEVWSDPVAVISGRRTASTA